MHEEGGAVHSCRTLKQIANGETGPEIYCKHRQKSLAFSFREIQRSQAE